VRVAAKRVAAVGHARARASIAAARYTERGENKRVSSAGVAQAGAVQCGNKIQHMLIQCYAMLQRTLPFYMSFYGGACGRCARWRGEHHAARQMRQQGRCEARQVRVRDKRQQRGEVARARQAAKEALLLRGAHMRC